MASTPLSAASRRKACSRASRLGLGLAALITAKLAAAPARRASNARPAPPRSSQRTLSSSVSARLIRISGCPFCRVSSTRLAGGDPDKKTVPRPDNGQLPAGVGDVVAGSSRTSTLMIAGTLPRSIKARESAAIISARNGAAGVGRRQPDDPAAIGEQAASQMIDLVAEAASGASSTRAQASPARCWRRA